MEQNEELYEIEVVYKSPPFSSMKRVKSPEDIVMVFRELITEEKIDYKEFFVVALLNRANALLGVSKISVGSAVVLMLMSEKYSSWLLKPMQPE
jgi:hypothetical protein